MFHKILLFTSSYIPLYILLLVKFILEKFEQRVKFKLIDFIIIVSILVIVCISFLYLILKLWLTKKDMVKEYEVKKCKNETVNYFFNYIAVYLISCMGLSLTRYADLFVVVFLMLLIGFIYVSNNIIYLNPVLNLIGYKIYEMELYYSGTNEQFYSIVILKNVDYIVEGMKISGTSQKDFIVAKCSCIND